MTIRTFKCEDSVIVQLANTNICLQYLFKNTHFFQILREKNLKFLTKNSKIIGFKNGSEKQRTLYNVHHQAVQSTWYWFFFSLPWIVWNFHRKKCSIFEVFVIQFPNTLELQTSTYLELRNSIHIPAEDWILLSVTLNGIYSISCDEEKWRYKTAAWS